MGEGMSIDGIITWKISQTILFLPLGIRLRPACPCHRFFVPVPMRRLDSVAWAWRLPPHRFEYIAAHGAPHSPLGLHTLVLTYSPSTIGYSYLHLR